MPQILVKAVNLNMRQSRKQILPKQGISPSFRTTSFSLNKSRSPLEVHIPVMEETLRGTMGQGADKGLRIYMLLMKALVG